MGAASGQSELSIYLGALAHTRVLVVGDVMLDRFIYGAVERISPEGPVPVLQVERQAAMLGGAGNVVRNLAALGVATDLVAVVGADDAGAQVRDLLAAEREVENHLITLPGRATTIKERYIAGGQQLLRADRESAGALDADTQGALLRAATDALDRSGALILSDYGKGLLDRSLLSALIEAAKAKGKPVVVDPKGRDYEVYRGASLVTPNRRELAEASGLPVEGDDQVEAACRRLIEACGVKAVLATRSEAGMTLVGEGGPGDGSGLWHLKAEAREVYDVSGAGDTVAAVVAAALAAGIALVEAAWLANLAAGVVVGKAGTAVARPDELVGALYESELKPAEKKLLDQESLLARAAAWRQAGLTIGFTNGCFDLLHPGHVALLRQARSACDRLVVGLNSDASVRRLKGEGRPVQNAAARATVLSSLADVDQVVVFAEDTPLDLIALLKPDLLIKGADYRVEQVVGADLVQGYGGRVMLAEIASGHSTSETIKKLTG